MKNMNEDGIKSVEDYNDEVDVEISTWLEQNEMPQWFVNELAEKYLNLTYIRERIRLLYPEIIKELKPYFEIHYDDEKEQNEQE